MYTKIPTQMEKCKGAMLRNPAKREFCYGNPDILETIIMLAEMVL